MDKQKLIFLINKLLDLLDYYNEKKADSYIINIFTHKNPDMDTLASGAALALIVDNFFTTHLKDQKVKVNLFHDKNTIYNKIHILSLISSLYNVPNELNLLNKISANNSKVINITVDSAEHHLIFLPDKLKTVIKDSDIDLKIDHHASGKDFAKTNIVFSEASSNAIIINELFNELLSGQLARFFINMYNEKSDKIYNIASLINIIKQVLAYGILTDTGFLSYSSVTKQDFEFFEDLDKYDIHPAEIEYQLSNLNSLNDFHNTIKVISNNTIIIHDTNKNIKIAYIIYTDELRKQLKDSSQLFIFYNLYRKTDFDYLFFIYKTDNQDDTNNLWKLSIRSNKNLSILKIVESLGGGGHDKAGGALLVNYTDKTYDELITLILNKILEV